jgi:uncharacterized protein (TIGR00725 family)
MRRTVIGVMGAGEPSAPCLTAARELGRLLAAKGWVVLTGGRPAGIMAATCAGAKTVDGSVTLGILPGASGGENPDVDIAVYTGMGEARNVINVLTSDVVVACGVEGPGTASEVALALRSGKPVILLGASDIAREFFERVRCGADLLTADTPQDVIKLIESHLGTRVGVTATIPSPGR